VPESSSPGSLLDAANLNHLWAQLLVEELVRSGVDTFFLAPGSRSTPLTTAVARHPAARSVMHFDERGTAFAALGYGRATGRPAGWVTTSGTAVANGFPAVAEAATDGVPILLLTADRPPERRDTGANQTIDQVKLFGDYVRWQFDLPTPTLDIAPAMVLTTADQAVYRAMRTPPGPVHLNCMFRKPLAPHPDGTARSAYVAALTSWADGEAPYTRYPLTYAVPGASEMDAVAAAVAAAERGVLTVGRLNTQAERTAVLALAGQIGWPLLADVTSGLRFGAPAPRIAHADQILTSSTFRETRVPDTVLHVGGRFVSKRLQTYVEATPPATHMVVRPSPSRIDPGHQVTHHIECTVASFCSALAERMTENGERSAWQQDWEAAERAARSEIAQFADAAERLSEPLVAYLVAQHIPSDHALVLASSMPVRDMNRYGSAQGAAVPVFANRGASGIDGTVATAAGVAHGRRAPLTLVIGDLALLHDLNALALLRAQPVIVIALNNNGGGIFHFLPIAAHGEVFEPYFATPHDRSFEHAAAMFDLEYACPDTVRAFTEAYRRACVQARSTLIEIRTERAENRTLHDDLEQRLARAVTATC
jgi:2-succinyl-5-enolpyruvyl-6-hydroxy-3-cyclohexene-1-carboxylate synthase